jgi:hypothetical protein
MGRTRIAWRPDRRYPCYTRRVSTHGKLYHQSSCWELDQAVMAAAGRNWNGGKQTPNRQQHHFLE